MRRLKPEHSTECAARPHKAHEQDQLTEFCICEVIACAGEHDFINAPVIACEVLGKLYGRCRTRIGMRAIGRTAFRLAVAKVLLAKKASSSFVQGSRMWGAWPMSFSMGVRPVLEGAMRGIAENSS